MCAWAEYDHILESSPSLYILVLIRQVWGDGHETSVLPFRKSHFCREYAHPEFLDLLLFAILFGLHLEFPDSLFGQYHKVPSPRFAMLLTC